MVISGNMIAKKTVTEVSARIPPSWRARLSTRRHMTHGAVVYTLMLGTRNGERVDLLLLPRATMDPVDVRTMASIEMPKDTTGVLVASPYLSPRTRQQLNNEGINYLDLTGNVSITLEAPALFIRTSGAERNPNPGSDRKRRTLKGAIAGRVVRVLCDTRPPYGVRELAARAQTTPGYISKLAATLGSDALIEREGRGPITAVDWVGLIRRWVEDYSLLGSNRSQAFLDPRGLPAFEKRLPKAGVRYAITGSAAASRLAPIAPAHLATCFVDDLDTAAHTLELRPAQAGANVILLEPYDEVVYERMWERGGLWHAAPSQVTADLLTSPGRGPAEAEELIGWMEEHVDEWRS